jgi:hypothetical protein
MTKTEAAKIVAALVHQKAAERFHHTNDWEIYARPFIEDVIQQAVNDGTVEAGAAPSWVTVGIQLPREVIKVGGTWIMTRDRVLDLAPRAEACDSCGNRTRTFIVDMTVGPPPKRWCSDCYDFDTGTVKDLR